MNPSLSEIWQMEIMQITSENGSGSARACAVDTKKARYDARPFPQDAAASLCCSVCQSRREARRSAGRLLLLLSCDFLLWRCALLGRFRCFLGHLFFLFCCGCAHRRKMCSVGAPPLRAAL